MKIKHLILALLLSTVAFAEMIDRVVAVVDKQIILKSELDAQVQLYAMQNKIDHQPTRLSGYASKPDA